MLIYVCRELSDVIETNFDTTVSCEVKTRVLEVHKKSLDFWPVVAHVEDRSCKDPTAEASNNYNLGN